MPPRGFEPLISTLKGWRPRPLDDGGRAGPSVSGRRVRSGPEPSLAVRPLTRYSPRVRSPAIRPLAPDNQKSDTRPRRPIGADVPPPRLASPRNEEWLMRVRTTVRSATPRATISFKRRALIAVASMAMVVGGVGTAAAAQPSSLGKTSNVIVVLRNQHTDLGLRRGHTASARTNAYHTDQATVITQAARRRREEPARLQHVNAVAATVTAAAGVRRWRRTRRSPRSIRICRSRARRSLTRRRQVPRPSVSARRSSPETICPSDPAKPLLEPEALQVTNTAFSDPSTPAGAEHRRRHAASRSPSSPTASTSTTRTSSARTAATSSSTTRTSPATAWTPRPVPPRPSVTRARSRPRAARPTTSPTT